MSNQSKFSKCECETCGGAETIARREPYTCPWCGEGVMQTFEPYEDGELGGEAKE